MLVYLVIVSLSVNAILLLWLFILTLKTRGYKASFKNTAKAAKEGKLPQVIDKNNRNIDVLFQKVEDLYSLNGKLNKKIEESYRNLGIIRFDAFPDIGGEQSYSMALLDDKKNGIVITSINGREESRTFVKQVQEGKGEPVLSAEEKQAVEKATTEPRQ